MSQNGSEIVSRFDSLRSRFNSLNSNVLDSVMSDIDSLSNDISSLPGKIADVRSRGYAFASYLEHKAEVMQNQWNGLRGQVQIMLSQEAMRLQGEVNGLRFRVDMAAGMVGNPSGLAGQLPSLESAINTLELARSAAQSRLETMYSTLQNDTAKTLDQLTNIHWYLDQWDQISFPKLSGETLFLAAKAEWVATGKGKDDPDGILYLTDQRLIMEQKETVGKTLGLFGGKKAQQLKWALPLNQVKDVVPENKGFLHGKDMLNFTMGNGAPFATAVVEVKGGVDSKFWAAQIKRMIAGQTTDERAIQPDAATLEAIRNAPTDCPSCGGTLPQLVANERQVACPYCGAVIRV